MNKISVAMGFGYRVSNSADMPVKRWLYPGLSLMLVSGVVENEPL